MVRNCWKSQLLSMVLWTLLLGIGTHIVSSPHFDVIAADWSETRDSSFEEQSAGWDDWKLSHFQPLLNQSEALTSRDKQDYSAWFRKIHAEVRAYRPPIYLMNLVLKLDC
jgi:hypothetical protein